MFDVVGLAAFKGSGKTTLAKYLEEKGFIRVSFADPIRELLELQNPYLLSDSGVRPLQEVLLQHDWQSLKTSEYSKQIRDLMVTTGKSLRAVDDDFFVRVAHERVAELLEDSEHIVIDDVRFPNEAKFISDIGGALIRINRPSVTNGDNPDVSELQNFPVHFTINNDGYLYNLYDQADHILL